MSVAVNGFYKPEKFTLAVEDLTAGFYECENGTLVFMVKGYVSAMNPVNVENGFGGYDPASRGEKYGFRKVSTTITIKPQF